NTLRVSSNSRHQHLTRSTLRFALRSKRRRFQSSSSSGVDDEEKAVWDDDFSGIYACQAINALGSSLPHPMEVRLLVAPRFADDDDDGERVIPAAIYLARGESFEIECAGFGVPPVERYWRRNAVKDYALVHLTISIAKILIFILTLLLFVL